MDKSSLNNAPIYKDISYTISKQNNVLFKHLHSSEWSVVHMLFYQQWVILKTKHLHIMSHCHMHKFNMQDLKDIISPYFVNVANNFPSMPHNYPFRSCTLLEKIQKYNSLLNFIESILFKPCTYMHSMIQYFLAKR